MTTSSPRPRKRPLVLCGGDDPMFDPLWDAFQRLTPEQRERADQLAPVVNADGTVDLVHLHDPEFNEVVRRVYEQMQRS